VGKRTGNSSPLGAAGDDVVIFFIHGSMGHMQQFEHQILYCVSKGWTVVAFDAYGCGESPKPYDWGAYSYVEQFEDLKAVYSMYKGRRNFLMGHSYGTSMALQLCAAMGADGCIPGLILIGPGFGPSHYPSKSVKIFRNPVIVLQLMAPLLRRGFIQRALHRETLERKTIEHQRLVELIAAKQGSNAMHICKSFYSQMEWVNPETIQQVDADVVLVVGEGDQMLPPQNAACLADLLRNQRPQRETELYVLKNGSHQVMQELPSEVNKLLDAFVLRTLKTRRV
jgi:abhydrolase domain-containing protein 8